MPNLTYQLEIKEAQGLDKIVAGLGVAGKGADKLHVSVKVLGNDLETAATKAKKLDSSFKGIGNTIDGVKGSVSNFFDFVGANLAADAIKAVASGLLDLGKHAIEAAAGAERMNLSFEFALGAEGAQDMLGWIDKITASTEFTDGTLKDWTLQLANAGLKGEALKDNMAAVLDIAAKRGPAGGAAAVDALSRATLTGKIEGRALRGLGIPVADLSALDKFQGLNEKQINKKLETTTISKDELLQLIAGPDKLLGDFAVKASTTMSAKLAHLKNLPEQFFEKFADSPAFDTMKERIDTLLTELDPNSPKGKAIFDGLETVFTTVVDLVEQIDFKSVADTIVSDVIPVVKDLVGLIGPAVELISTTVSGLSAVGSGLSKAWNFNFGLGKETVDAAEAAERAEGRRRSSLSIPKSIKDSFAASFGDVGQAGGDAPKTLAASVNANRGMLAVAGADMGQSLMDGLDNKLERHSPPRVFMRVGADIPRAVALGIESESASLDEAVDGMVNLPGPSTTGAAGLGGTSISISISVSMGGGDRQQAEAAGQVIGDALEERLQAFFERKQMEQAT